MQSLPGFIAADCGSSSILGWPPGQRQSISVASIVHRQPSIGKRRIVLVSLVSLIFANILPGVRATTVQRFAAISFLIVVNALLSHVLTPFRSCVEYRHKSMCLWSVP